jgi:hypothetical protein
MFRLTDAVDWRRRECGRHVMTHLIALKKKSCSVQAGWSLGILQTTDVEKYTGDQGINKPINHYHIGCRLGQLLLYRAVCKY